MTASVDFIYVTDIRIEEGRGCGHPLNPPLLLMTSCSVRFGGARCGRGAHGSIRVQQVLHAASHSDKQHGVSGGAGAGPAGR